MKLYRLPYSPFARKVQALLDLLGYAHVVVDIPYSDRTELATVSGGYALVPVLVDNDGSVVCDSRKICQHLLRGPAAVEFVPPPLEGPIWAYADWCDGALEDVMFRIGSPSTQRNWTNAGDRALYTLIKERKFGTGCVDEWRRNHDQLVDQARTMLEPTVQTLATQPFVFGSKPTLADVALYGEFAMLATVDPTLLTKFQAPLVAFARRMDELTAAHRFRA